MVLHEGDKCIVIQTTEGMKVLGSGGGALQEGDSCVIIPMVDGTLITLSKSTIIEGDTVLIIKAADGNYYAIKPGGGGGFLWIVNKENSYYKPYYDYHGYWVSGYDYVGETHNQVWLKDYRSLTGDRGILFKWYAHETGSWTYHFIAARETGEFSESTVDYAFDGINFYNFRGKCNNANIGWKHKYVTSIDEYMTETYLYTKYNRYFLDSGNPHVINANTDSRPVVHGFASPYMRKLYLHNSGITTWPGNPTGGAGFDVIDPNTGEYEDNITFYDDEQDIEPVLAWMHGFPDTWTFWYKYYPCEDSPTVIALTPQTEFTYQPGGSYNLYLLTRTFPLAYKLDLETNKARLFEYSTNPSNAFKPVLNILSTCTESDIFGTPPTATILYHYDGYQSTENSIVDVVRLNDGAYAVAEIEFEQSFPGFVCADYCLWPLWTRCPLHGRYYGCYGATERDTMWDKINQEIVDITGWDLSEILGDCIGSSCGWWNTRSPPNCDYWGWVCNDIGWSNGGFVIDYITTRVTVLKELILDIYGSYKEKYEVDDVIYYLMSDGKVYGLDKRSYDEYDYTGCEDLPEMQYALGTSEHLVNNIFRLVDGNLYLYTLYYHHISDLNNIYYIQSIDITNKKLVASEELAHYQPPYKDGSQQSLPEMFMKDVR